MSDQAQGILYLCATPIGNLEDVTLRVIRVLKEADLIAAEDTRRTRKLLTFYDIHTRITSYHEHNEQKKGKYLLDLLLAGKQVALVTDAGMPGISDPGEKLVLLAIEHGVTVVPVPGPNAALAALVVSGLNATRFCFEGFLPAASRSRRERATALKSEERTLLFYEAPHRLQRTLSDLLDCLGDRQVAVARELTKLHEDVWRGRLSKALEYFKEQAPLGEFTLVVEGAKEAGLVSDGERFAGGKGQSADRCSLAGQVSSLEDGGFTRQTAIREVARCNNLPRREVYAAVVWSKGKRTTEDT
jgi:16S rRNA (cytidine1402-2'-O)-methyltransferase